MMSYGKAESSEKVYHNTPLFLNPNPCMISRINAMIKPVTRMQVTTKDAIFHVNDHSFVHAIAVNVKDIAKAINPMINQSVGLYHLMISPLFY
jgi:hypothetical protein